MSLVANTGRSTNSRSRYGSEPTWSSCPWVSTTASMRSRLSLRYCTSGSTRSMPGISTVGNDRPASITRMRPPSSSAAMFRPTSPTPPRKTSRGSPPRRSDEAKVPHGAFDRSPLLRRGGHQGQAGWAAVVSGQIHGVLQARDTVLCGHQIRGVADTILPIERGFRFEARN